MSNSSGDMIGWFDDRTGQNVQPGGVLSPDCRKERGRERESMSLFVLVNTRSSQSGFHVQSEQTSECKEEEEEEEGHHPGEVGRPSAWLNRRGGGGSLRHQRL